MRFRIRKAQIRDDLRQHFELFGQDVIALALGLGAMQGGGGFGPATAPTNAMMTVFQNQGAAAQWLQEKRDQAEWHATRLEICEWAILLFVGLSVALEIRNLIVRIDYPKSSAAAPAALPHLP
jgi:hypothetical protein